MSQEKVDRRKEYKKNRKKILAKEKRSRAISKAIGYLCLLVIVGGVGFSFYQKVKPAVETETSSAFYSLIATDDYGILSPSLAEE